MSELIHRIIERNPRLSQKEARKLVGAIIDTISGALASGDRVELRDFGTFAVTERLARTGRNPRTGLAIDVEAKRAIAFRPGKGVREALRALTKR